MFEKEAEEYAENREVCGLLDAISENLQNYDYGTVAHYNIDPLVEECFKDGATFGYNKANEWHYPSKGEYPKTKKKVLVQLKDVEEPILDYYRQDGLWNYALEDEVVAWKEIVLPELKED